MSRTFVLCIAVFLSRSTLASAQQSGTVTGAIRSVDGEPVAGATVRLRDTRVTTRTDIDGAFTLLNIAPGTYALHVAHTGFAPQAHRVTIAAGESVNVSIALQPAMLPLQQIDVTASGEVRPGITRPYSSGRLNAGQLQVPTNGSVMAAMAGKLPGVIVLGSNGELSQPASIRLRTSGLFMNGEATRPLVVIDGVILPPVTGDTDFDIASDDIESIEVLRGPVAAAEYGSRGAAGVIRIATKRGDRAPFGSVRFDYRMETSFEKVGPTHPLSSHHRYLMSADGSQAVDMAGNPVSWEDRVVDVNHGFFDRAYPGPIQDHVATVFDPAPALRQTIRVSRSGNAVDYSVAFNRLDGGSFMNGDDRSRNQLRGSIDYRLRDHLEFSVTGSHADADYDALPSGAFAAVQFLDPYLDLAARDSAGHYLPYGSGVGISYINPLYTNATEERAGTKSRSLLGLRAVYSPADWFTLDAHGGTYREQDRFRWILSVPDPNPFEFPELTQVTNRRAKSRNGEVGASMRRELLGWSTRTRLSAGLGKDRVYDSSVLLTDGDLRSSSTSWSEVERRHYALAVSSNRGDTWTVDAVIRRDKHPRWMSDDRWQTGYRAGVSYRAGGEPWFSVPGIDDLALRAATARASYQDAYVLPNQPVANAARPPRTTEHEFGVTAVLFDGRAAVDLTWAKQKTRGRVLRSIMSPPFGYSWADQTHVGRSLEAALHTRLVNTSSFSIDVGAVAAKLSSEITDLPNGCLWTNTRRLCEGDSYGVIRGRSFMHSTDDLPASVRSRASEFQVNDDGYLVWVGTGNTYHDGIAKQLWGTSTALGDVTAFWGEPILMHAEGAAQPEVVLGNSIPDLNYGFTTTVRWNNLTVHGEFRGQVGGQVYNDGRRFLYWQLRHADVDQSGLPDERKKPVDYYLQGLQSYPAAGINEHFVEDASYLRLGALSARYRVDGARLSQALGAWAPSELAVSITGRNLFTLTGYDGMDPEAGTPLMRMEGYDYPVLRTIVAAVEIAF